MVPRDSAGAQGDLLRGIPPARIKLIEKIAAEARERTAGTSIDLRRRFLRAYFRGVGEEDIAQREPLANARTALRHLETGYQRTPGKALVEVFNPDTAGNGLSTPHTVVMIVTDDMPFLVDSLGVALSKAGVAIHLLIHPVLWVKRDSRGRLLEVVNGPEEGARSESWQLYEVDRQTDPAQITALRDRLTSVLRDVRLAVEDWMPMRERIRAISQSLKNDPPLLPKDEVAEAHALLDWMEERHFVFLGYRQYRLERGDKQDRLVPERRSGLGILRDPEGAGAKVKSTILKGAVREHARARELLILTKANSTATVHRGTYLDYVGIKTFGSRGEVTGEHRFIGLWTSTAYLSSPHDIPVLRRKVQQVMDHFALDPASHDAKAVLHVLETYPRDELFQAEVDDLIRISRGVVNLYERRTVRLLARRDPYHRFYSCLIYVPRDRYNTEVRLAIEQIVAEGFHGTQVESQVQIADSNHARLHVVVRTEPNGRDDVDFDAIERRIAEAATTWNDRLRAVLLGKQDEASALALANRYRRAFPLAYEEDVDPADALEDLQDLESLRNEPQALRLNLYRPRQQKAERLHLKLLKLGEPVPISDLLPMLENFGLRVISERPYELAWPDGGAAWIQDFELEHRERTRVDISRIEMPFREAFAATLAGEVENDGFNRLLIAANLNVREIVVMRAYCKYLLQTGVPFAQASIERTLATNGGITQNLMRLFTTLFDPAGGRQSAARAEKIVGSIRAALENVASLDEDRILRSYMNLVQATLRTNFYQVGKDQKPKSYVSFKLDPHKIPDLPLPRPKYEIFVYSPRVEGVHLRMGDVARGGLRWSDRRDDFRTEVLGLMKAQNVKNTVIVPVGAKAASSPSASPRARAMPCRPRASRATRRSSAGCSMSRTTSSAGAWSRRPPSCDGMATIRTSSWLRIKARQASRTSRTPSPSSTASGSATRSPPAAQPGTTTRAWASPPGARGSPSNGTSASSGSTSSPRISPRPALGTCQATCSATGCCCPVTCACRPRSIISTSSWIRIRTRQPALSSASGSSTCRAPRGTTTIGRRSPAAAGCIRVRRSPSRCLRPRSRCCGSKSPRRRRTKSSAQSCACRWTCFGTVASART